MMKRYLLSALLSAPFLALNAQYYWYHEEVDFETNLEFIRIDTGTSNAWQIGPPQKYIFSGAYSVPNVIVTDTVEPYPVNCNSSFYLSIKDLNWFTGSPSTLSFFHKYDCEAGHDGGFIDVSYDGGQNWLNIIYDSTMFNCSWTPGFGYYGNNFYGDDDTLFNGTNGFSGTAEDWQHSVFTWWYCIGVEEEYPDSMMIRFNFQSDGIQSGQEGWMIDDIVLDSDICGDIREHGPGMVTSTIDPNPVVQASVLKIDGAFNAPCTLAIADMTGVLMFSGLLTSDEFHIGRLDLDPGVYVYALSFEKGDSVKGKFTVY